jgi:uncharacterized membrane protein
MNNLGAHIRNKFLAGAFTATPIVIIVFVAVWLEQNTQPLTRLLGLPPIPGLGVALGLVAVYLLGIAATSLVGGILAHWLDHLLQRIPGLNLVYRTWKDVFFMPPGKMGVYNQVVLVPSRVGAGKQIGFTSGASIAGDPPQCCVFVPGLPNPLSGQLILLPSDVCTPLSVSVEEAFKFLLSTGNYVPPGIKLGQR